MVYTLLKQNEYSKGGTKTPYVKTSNKRVEIILRCP